MGEKNKVMCKFLNPTHTEAREAKGCFPLGLWECRSSVSGPTCSETLAKKSALSYSLKVTSSQGSESKQLRKHNWFFSFVLHFLASVNILLQNTNSRWCCPQMYHEDRNRDWCEDDSEGGSDEWCTDKFIHWSGALTTTSSNMLQPKIHMLLIILNITSLIDSYPRELDQYRKRGDWDIILIELNYWKKNWLVSLWALQAYWYSPIPCGPPYPISDWSPSLPQQPSQRMVYLT